MWSIQCFIVLLSSRVSYFPATIRRWYRNSVGVIPLKNFSSDFHGFKSGTERLRYNSVIVSEINVSKLKRIFQTQIWDPVLAKFQIGDGGVKLRLDLITKSRFILYSTFIDSHFFVRKRLTIVGEIVDYFFPAKVLGNDAIHSNDISEKDKVSLLYGVFVHGRKGFHHLPSGRFMSHIDTIKTKTLDCIRETNIHVATIRLGEAIHTRTKDFKADANIRVTKPQFLQEPLWQQLWERRQHLLHYQHRESLLQSSNMLISSRCLDSESSSTTLNSNLPKKVMPRAFWSLSAKLLANQKYVKEGHNRLYLLAYKSKDSMVTLHSFIEIVIISCICVNGRFEMLMYLVNTF